MSRAVIYLPKEAENYDDALHAIQSRLCDAFGGCTSYDARGHWVDDDGDVIDEPCTVVETFDDGDRHPELRTYGTVHALAEEVYRITDESAIMVAVDGEKYLITDGD